MPNKVKNVQGCDASKAKCIFCRLVKNENPYYNHILKLAAALFYS